MMRLPSRSTSAFRIRIRMKPSAIMKGSRKAARSGGRTAFRIATTAAIRRASKLFTTVTPGRMQRGDPQCDAGQQP